MAQRVSTTVTDDINGEEGASTIYLGLDRTEYEIDLTPENQDALRQALAPYITNGRRVPRNGNGKGKSNGAVNGNGRGPDRERTAAIREWAREQGMGVNERGRIPGRVVEAYEQANAA